MSKKNSTAAQQAAANAALQRAFAQQRAKEQAAWTRAQKKGGK